MLKTISHSHYDLQLNILVFGRQYLPTGRASLNYCKMVSLSFVPVRMQHLVIKIIGTCICTTLYRTDEKYGDCKCEPF